MSLKRESFLKKLELDRDDDLYTRLSTGVGLDTALKKLKKEFHISDYHTVNALYEDFEELDINPVTLCNNSTHSDCATFLFIKYSSPEFWSKNYVIFTISHGV